MGVMPCAGHHTEKTLAHVYHRARHGIIAVSLTSFCRTPGRQHPPVLVGALPPECLSAICRRALAAHKPTDSVVTRTALPLHTLHRDAAPMGG